MAFESVRGYVQLASGLGELTKARALEAAQGLLSLPGVTSTGKVAGQVTTLADELLAAATTNRENLTTLVRSEVEAAVSRLGLVPVAELEAARAQVTRLRAELAQVRSADHAEEAAAAQDAAAPARGGEARRPARATRAAATAGAAPAAVPARKAATKRTFATGAAGTATSASASAGPATKRSAAKRSATKASAAKTTAARSAAKASATKASATQASAATTSTAKNP